MKFLNGVFRFPSEANYSHFECFQAFLVHKTGFKFSFEDYELSVKSGVKTMRLKGSV